MGLLGNFVAGAVGYGIAEASKSHKLRDVIDERFSRSTKNVSLEALIDEYARKYEVYTQKNEFAHRLHQIAERYEEYDYEEVYGRR
jgi:FKBP-type peptidyl-prolyl cis-trans isomerase (trigger factor)